MPHASDSNSAPRRILLLTFLALSIGLLPSEALLKHLRPAARAAATFTDNTTGDGARGTLIAGAARDAQLPTVVVLRSAVAEGNSGTATLFFTVKLSSPSDQPVTVGYSTEDSSAQAPEDYQSASGAIVFNPGETVKQVGVVVNGDTKPELPERFDLRLTSLDGATASAGMSAGGSIWDDDSPGIHFSAPSYAVGEKDGSVEIKVERRGNTSTPATAFCSLFISGDPFSASPVSDYTTTHLRLDFAPGETEKSFTVLVNDDAYVEEPESVALVIFRPDPGPGEPGFLSGLLIINSDDTQPPTAANNPVDETAFFVRQHYHDFLNREPDPEGFRFWTNEIESCGADAQCREVKRISVSAAFFFSIEFQRTGFRVFRVYRATSPADDPSNRRGMPLDGEFIRDAQVLGFGVVVGQDGWEERLRQNVEKYTRGWVTSDLFVRQFPSTMTAAQFVDKLFFNSGVTPTAQEREAALAAYGAGGTEGRAAALLSVIDSGSVYNRQFNPGFVYAEYVGYLRRGPVAAPELNFEGFDYWLAKLDSFTPPGEDVRDEAAALRRVQRAEMVKAFISSAEYRRRFGL